AHCELASIGESTAIPGADVVDDLARADVERPLVPDAAAGVVRPVAPDACGVEGERRAGGVEDAAAEIGHALQDGAVGQSEVAEVENRSPALADRGDETVLDGQTGDGRRDPGCDQEDPVEMVGVNDRLPPGTTHDV